MNYDWNFWIKRKLTISNYSKSIWEPEKEMQFSERWMRCFEKRRRRKQNKDLYPPAYPANKVCLFCVETQVCLCCSAAISLLLPDVLLNFMQLVLQTVSFKKQLFGWFIKRNAFGCKFGETTEKLNWQFIFRAEFQVCLYVLFNDLQFTNKSDYFSRTELKFQEENGIRF